MRRPSILTAALPLKLGPGAEPAQETRRRWPLAAALIALAAFSLGAALGNLPITRSGSAQALRGHLLTQEIQIRKLQGELELQRLQAERLSRIVHFSSQFDISADLAELIYDVAVFEDLEPELAFRLVRVESGFRRSAVSPKGAVGYTQILPSTARWLDPTVKRSDLFEPETNLHLGFRYLRYLLDEYRGDVRLALLAYNRGPSTVAGLVSLGLDPSNGYARAVCDGEPCHEKLPKPGAGVEREPIRVTSP